MFSRHKIKIIVLVALFLAASAFAYYARQNSKAVFSCPTELNEQQCWQYGIETALHDQGLDAALDLLATLYETKPAFAETCHGNTHTLGAAAYELFVQQKEFHLTPKTSYCGYGFYHGFMEALILDSHDFAEARAFCDYAEKQLAAYTENAAGACYHGIGHGAVDGGDPRDWGDEDALIRAALVLCDQVSVISDNYHRCASGVYNALVLAYGKKEFDLDMPRDPFAACEKNMREEYRIACYEQMNALLMILADHDLKLAVAYAEKVKGEVFAAKAIYSLAESAAAPSNIQYRTPDEVATICQSLRTPLVQPCLSGFATGLIEHGPPGHEHEASLAFCQNPLIAPGLQRGCLTQVFVFLNVLFPEQKVQQFCRENLQPTYRKDYCDA